METLNSFIHSVVVFQSGAEVTRKAELPERNRFSPHVVRLTGLPLCLLDSTLTARLAGKTAAVVGARVEVLIESQDSPPHEEMEQVRRAKERLLRERSRLTRSRECLHELAVLPRPQGKEGEPPPPVSTQPRIDLLRFKQEQWESLSNRLREIEARLKQTDDRLIRLKASERSPSVSKTAVLTIEGEWDASELSLTYRVPGARWTPSYVLRFNPELSRAEALMRVCVIQATGEDWNEVELSVTTAPAEQIRELPELSSIRIGKSQPPPPPKAWRKPPADTLALLSDFDRALKNLGTEEPFQALPSPEPVPPPPPPPPRPAPVVQSAAPVSGLMDAQQLAAPAEAPMSMPREAEAGGASVPSQARILKKEVADMSRARAGSAPAPGGALIKDKAAGALPVPVQDPVMRDYSRLVMKGPRESHRAHLRLQSLHDQVSEEARRLGLSREGLLAQVDRAVNRAERASRRDLPPHHLPPLYPGEEPFDLFLQGQNRCSVPSDGSYHTQPLRLFELATRPRLVTVPRETEQVFRTVEVSSREVLPAGPADIYVGKSFLLSGPLKGVAPGGSLHLALGVEEAVRVSRVTHFTETSSGVVSKTRRLEHTIEVELRNGLPRPVEVEIRERLPHPHSVEKDIEVDVTSCEPKWEPFTPAEQPDFEHARRWTVNLEPEEKKTMKAVYTISLPYKYELQDGNRRE